MSALRPMDWPEGERFTFHDEPGKHDPCYVIMPGGAMIPLNHRSRLARGPRIWPQRGRRLGGGDLMIDYFTIEIGSGGSTVMVEPELRKGLTRRVFRRMLDGSLEWAAYDDWRTHNERARFFGFASRDLPSSMTS